MEGSAGDILCVLVARVSGARAHIPHTYSTPHMVTAHSSPRTYNMHMHIAPLTPLPTRGRLAICERRDGRRPTELRHLHFSTPAVTPRTLHAAARSLLALALLRSVALGRLVGGVPVWRCNPSASIL